jgi:hypothetical protein
MDVIAANPPPELAHYLTSNDTLPSYLSPRLHDFLQKSAQAMDRLEDEMYALEAILQSKRETYDRARHVHNAHVKIRAPIRRVPPELLGIIFTVAVNRAPFNRYIDITRLRGVCSLWRHMAFTKRGLWSTLPIDIEKWCTPDLSHRDDNILSTHFRAILHPWLSILLPAYNLEITLLRPPSSSYSVFPRKDQSVFIHHLLSSAPLPASVTFDSHVALSAALASSYAYQHIRKVELARVYLYSSESDKLEHVFPWLRTLILHSMFECRSDRFDHSRLRTLQLSEVRGIPHSFALLLKGLPRLRELRLDTRGPINALAGTIDSDSIFEHPCIEVLMIRGEDILGLLGTITLPSLRFLSLRDMSLSSQPATSDYVLLRLFAKSPPCGLTVSLTGGFSPSSLAQIARCLPPRTHLHFSATIDRQQDGSEFHLSFQTGNVQDIYCDSKTADLSWLSGDPSRSPVTIHVPADVVFDVLSQSRQKELEGAGYRIEMRSMGEIEAMIRLRAPEYRARWDWNALCT